METMESTTVRSCRACGQSLRGRTDKKFCDDLCRNNYNNRLRAPENNYTRRVIDALRKNRHILSAQLGELPLAKVSRERLLALGFQFRYHTHDFTNKKGSRYTYCFEYGYLTIDEEWLLLVKRDPQE
jgi:hypothetical protein